MSVPPFPSSLHSGSLEKGDSQSDREFTSMLIELYRGQPVLWKVKHRDYFNRNKKNKAWDKMVVALRTLKPGYTLDELKRKINSLRSNFNREFKLIRVKKVFETSPDDIPEPSLWYYNDILFIKDQLEIAPTDTSEQEPPVDVESASNQEPSRPNKKIKSTKDSADKLVGLAIEHFKRSDSEEDILARAWAMKLKRMAPDQKRFAEKIITDVLFDADMGTVTWEGVRFVTANRPWSEPPPPMDQYSYVPGHSPSYVSPSSCCPSPSSD